MIVEPSDEDFFVSKFLHDVIRLVGFSKSTDLRKSFECYFSGEIYLGKNKNTLMVCQTRPRTICSLFSITNWGMILTTVQPMALAD